VGKARGGGKRSLKGRTPRSPADGEGKSIAAQGVWPEMGRKGDMSTARSARQTYRKKVPKKEKKGGGVVTAP